jgi:hypothetical protein
MLTTHKLLIDYNCEVPELLAPLAHSDFFDFGKEEFDVNATYIVGRTTVAEHNEKIRSFIDQGVKFVFSNPAEGSTTMSGQFVHLNILDLVLDRKMSVISGGEIAEDVDYYNHDNFAVKLSNFDENIQAMSSVSAIHNKKDKPYTFLFLNGRMRTHRKWMLARLRQLNLLQDSLYTNLHERAAPRGGMQVYEADTNLMDEIEPIVLLPKQYEVDRYAQRIARPSIDRNIKSHLFKVGGHAEWGEAYIKPEPYIDTYFSLVSETIFQESPMFRTEKIWKPIIIGHPFVAMGSQYFYKHLHNLGFQTFSSLIDESWDSIEDGETRAEGIAQTILSMCKSDLNTFQQQAKNICLHNQQRFLEYSQQLKDEFPNNFKKWIETL